MIISRSHIGMMGIISLFTGMVAPIFGLGEHGYPFALTSIQAISYILLFLLALCFYLVSIRRWHAVRMLSLILALLLSYITIRYLAGSIYAGSTDIPLDSVRWGVFFVLIGIIFLGYSAFTKKIDGKSDNTILSDTIIGIVGTLTLLGLSALIIAGSIGTKFPTKTHSILEKTHGSGSTQSMSGVTMTVPYDNISSLVFERKNDRLSYIVNSESEGVLYPEGIFYSGSDIKYLKIGSKILIKSNAGTLIDGEVLPSDTEAREGILKIQTENGVRFVSKSLDVSYTGATRGIGDFSVSEDGSTIVWTERTSSGVVLKKNNETISNSYRTIYNITPSKNGKSIMAIGVVDSGENVILKNGIPVETIRLEYREGTWKSNGIHSIYVTDNNGLLSVIYDGVSIGKDFDEIRDIFLEKSGNSYAFFGKKKGENTYCLITRFKGSLCGLEGYMNPGIGADGSTIIYAGLKENTWSLYRNTDTVIRDTHYTRRDISGDYLFYDKTNPREYLFVEKMGEEQYQLRKKGKLIPGTWKDVGLEVAFGYDGKVIMSAKDSEGWRIIEL